MPELGADPGAVRVDNAGRKGWRLSDGSTLWDDGEKEVPVSGLSDEHKRQMARIAAGDAYEAVKPGVTDAEISAFKGVMAVAADPEKANALRKAAAKARAGRKPAEGEAELPPTDVEIRQNLRIEAHKLLEREIERLEELKSMAIAGLVMLARHGALIGGSNPPMMLHEVVLGLLKVSDSGTAEQMVSAIDMARAWAPLAAEPEPATPQPEPPAAPAPDP